MVKTMRGQFGGQNPGDVYQGLVDLIYQNSLGEAYDVEKSLDMRVSQMRFTLEEIAEGEWNGIPIRDPSQIPDYLEMAVKPLLEAASAVMNVVSNNGGFTSHLHIEHEDRKALAGTHTVDLVKAEQTIVGGINEWLRYIDEHTEFQKPGLPLAVNSPARTDLSEGIGRLSDVATVDQDGWRPINFLSNEEATRILNQPDPRQTGKLKV